MTRITCLMAGLAIIATSGAAHAQNAWTAGAPGGTSGGAIDFDQTAVLDTGLATADIYGAGGTASGDYTVSAWINPDTTNEGWFVGTTNEAFHGGLLDQDGTFALRQGHWGNDSGGTTPIVAGDWVHATFSYDADGGTGGTIGLQSVYLNGVLDGSADNGAPNNTAGNFTIGGRIRNATEGTPPGSGLNRQPWDGQIDDVAFFDAALSATQIADLASGALGAVALGANAYYDFEDDITGTTAAAQGSSAGNLAAIGGITPTAVPEPSSLAFLACIGAAGLVRRKRS